MYPHPTISSSERRFEEKGIVARAIGDIGWGLFAETTFAPGEPIFQLDLQDKSRSILIPQLEAFGDCHERSMTVVPDFAICCLIEHPFWFVNHHCESNSGFVNWGRIEEGKMPFVAHREIAPGEQITCEYSLITGPGEGTPEGDPWTMGCLCGKDECRGQIVAFRELPLPLQVAGVMPADPPRGRVLAHILAHETHVVDILKAYPLHYRQYTEVLRQQQDISAYLRKTLGKIAV